MSACPNCKTKLTCGCQKRTASNGATVCSTCLAPYEAQIKSKVVVKDLGTAPSNVTILYNGPSKLANV